MGNVTFSFTLLASIGRPLVVLCRHTISTQTQPLPCRRCKTSSVCAYIWPPYWAITRRLIGREGCALQRTKSNRTKSISSRCTASETCDRSISSRFHLFFAFLKHGPIAAAVSNNGCRVILCRVVQVFPTTRVSGPPIYRVY